MTAYRPPLDEYAFLLRQVLDYDRHVATLLRYADMDADLVLSVLDEAGKFCTNILEPLNLPGDKQGCRLENGDVLTPDGMRQAYGAFVEAGWGALSGDPDHGGQGLPRTVQILLDEMLSSAHMSFGLFTGLTRGAAEAIAEHAAPWLRDLYLPKLITGEWTGAMALTEASAGTDLGLLTTRAVPQDDGSHAITGTKIFISSGDHDFGGNVVHLVLARLAGAPAGIKGISLFLVPKFLVDEATGQLGDRNAVFVGSLEEKMGIHAQPTCVMNYDGARGWLVGVEGRGLNAMFTMMNAERLFVGVQGLGIAEIANQKATAYAHERLQGRTANGGTGPVPIICHPDVRKMLLTGRTKMDAGRALAIWTAMQMDVAAAHPDPQARESAEEFVALLTPVIKAALSDFGFETAVASQQVLGGHGYVREWGMEQFVRDARITQIYEGTNGVQALDLVTRKINMNGGKVCQRFFDQILADVSAMPGKPFIGQATKKALADLKEVTGLIRNSPDQALFAAASASEYLRLFALVACGWMWTRMAAADAQGMESSRAAMADYFAARVLPEASGLATMIRSGAKSVMAPPLLTRQ